MHTLKTSEIKPDTHQETLEVGSVRPLETEVISAKPPGKIRGRISQTPENIRGKIGQTSGNIRNGIEQNPGNIRIRQNPGNIRVRIRESLETYGLGCDRFLERSDEGSDRLLITSEVG